MPVRCLKDRIDASENAHRLALPEIFLLLVTVVLPNASSCNLFYLPFVLVSGILQFNRCLSHPLFFHLANKHTKERGTRRQVS